MLLQSSFGGRWSHESPPVLLVLVLVGALDTPGFVDSAEVFRDCTRDLYDRVVRFEYLYYDGYWMYPYHKLKQHGPSYHYTEEEFCE